VTIVAGVLTTHGKQSGGAAESSAGCANPQAAMMNKLMVYLSRSVW